MKKLLLMTSVFAFAGTICLFDGVSNQAEAGCWSCARETTLQKTNSILKETRTSVNNVRTEVRESADRLIAALKLQTGEQSAHFDKQIEAQKRITDAAQLNDSTRLRQQFRASAESGTNDPSPDLCIIAGLFKGASSGTPSGSQAVGSQTALAVRAKTDASTGGTANTNEINKASMTYKGLMNSTDPTTDPRLLVETPTSLADTDEKKAAMTELVKNMTNPFPTAEIPDAIKATPAGQAQEAARKIQATRAASGQELLASIQNMREAKGPVNAQWQDRIDGISNYAETVGGSVPKEISELQGLDIRTLYYYAPTSEKLQERQNMSEKALLQTLVDNMSIGNRLSYLNLQLNMRRGMVETQILSTLMGQ